MINLTVVIDNDEAIKKLRELQSVAKSSTSSIVADSERMDDSFNKIKNSIAGLAAGVSISALANQVVKVRGEVQQLEVAFETMLGSKEKADKLLAESIELAAKTPFGLQDVSNGAKMLLAYGSAAEEVTEEIKMLGNIASGLSIPLNDLIYLYGTTRTQGQMFTMDLRQFMGRGIPLAEELAKQFGVAKDEVGQLVTDGKVGFDNMRTALEAMTGEGGKFYNLMEKQSQTITGQISNLEDSIFQMFNTIGEKSEGIISGAISVVASLVESYERVGRTLLVLAATYGVYRTAVMLAAATSKGYTIAELAQYSALVLVEKAQKLLNATMLKNPYVLAATAVAALVTLLISQKNETERLREAEENYAAAKQEVIDKENEHMDKINELLSVAEDESRATDLRRDALHKLIQQYPEVFAKYETEYAMLQNIKQIKLEIAQIEAGKSITNPKNELAEVEKQIAAIMAPLKNNENLSGASIAYGYTLSDDDKARLKQLENRRRILLSEIDNSRKDAEMLNLGTLSDAELDKKIQQVQNALDENTKYGYVLPESLRSFNIFLKDVGDNTNPDRLEGDMIKLQAEKQRRNASKKTATDYIKEYKNAADEATKAYKDFIKNGRKEMTAEEFKKESKRLKEDMEAKTKEYNKYTFKGSGGKGRSSKTTAEEKARKEKEAKSIYEDIQQYNEDAKIALMKDGTDKEIAQINQDYDRKIAEIRANEMKLIALQGQLTDEQNAAFQLALKNANDIRVAETEKANKEVQKAQEASMNEYYIAYGTLQEKILATQAKYDAAIADAATEGEKKMLEAERDALLAQYETQASDWAKDLVNKNIFELEKMTKDLNAELRKLEDEYQSLDSSDTESANKLIEQINLLKAKIAELEDQTSDAKANIKGEEWGDAAQVLQGITSACTDAADAFGDVNGALGETFKNMGQIASSAASLVVSIGQVVAASGALNIALGVIGLVAAAIQAVGTAISMFQDNYTQEETEQQARELNEELVRMRKLADIDNWEDTIFGKDAFGNFINNIEVVQDSLDDLEDIQEKIINRGKEIWDVIGYTNAGFKMGMVIRNHRYNSLEESISNMQVKTRDRSGFAEFFGAEDEYANLGDLAPEIFKDGKVTLDGLKELKNSDLWNKLSKKNRALIDELIANWDRYEEATNAVTEYLTDIFGELGQTMTDALVESFASGTDAALAFGEATSEMLDKLAKDMLHMAFIQPIIDKYSEKIKALNSEEMSPEERVRQMAALINEMSQEVLATQDQVNAAAGQIRDDMAALGYDVFDSTTGQSSSSKGFSAMSQQTGDELNGRFTDIQGKVTGINDTLQFIKSINTQQLQQTTSINQTVAMIRNDTQLIEKHTRVLGQMSEDISSIKRSIDNGVL